MALSRPGFLATQGVAAGALLVPGRLLAALEATSPKPPQLDDWAKVRGQFRLSPEYVHLAGFFIASHRAPVREAIDSWRKAIDEKPFLVVDQGLFEDEARNVQSRVREAAASYLGGKPDEVCLLDREPARPDPNNAHRMTPGGFQAYEHQWAMVAAFRMHQAIGQARVAARVAELNGGIKDGLAEMRASSSTPPGPGALCRNLLLRGGGTQARGGGEGAPGQEGRARPAAGGAPHQPGLSPPRGSPCDLLLVPGPAAVRGSAPSWRARR